MPSSEMTRGVRYGRPSQLAAECASILSFRMAGLAQPPKAVAPRQRPRKLNRVRVVRPGAFVRCAVTGVPIPLEELKYWSVDLQEAYATPEAVLQRYEQQASKQ